MPEFEDTPIINPSWLLQKITVKPDRYVAEEIVVTVFGKTGEFRLFYL